MCGSVHRGIFSTLREYHEYIRGVKYIRGYHECMEEGDIMNTLGDIMMHVGDTMSTLRDVQYIRGYHEYIGDIMSTLEVSIEIERIYQVAPPNAS